MTHRSFRGRFTAAALVALVLVAAMPAVAVAHAEFVSSTPADGDAVEGSPATVTAEFTEPLADGSVMRIRNSSGEVVGEGRIDVANPELMVIEPGELAPGEYSVQWQALADDRHRELGTFSFTVTSAATPVPTASPAPPASSAGTPTEPPSPSPAPSVATTPSPAATEIPSDATAGSGDALIPILVVVVLVALLGGYLLLRRRPPARP
jgi:methionine-rich copper-binding protein CopC